MPGPFLAVVTTIITQRPERQLGSSVRGQEGPGAESLWTDGPFLCFQCKPSSVYIHALWKTSNSAHGYKVKR